MPGTRRFPAVSRGKWQLLSLIALAMVFPWLAAAGAADESSDKRTAKTAATYTAKPGFDIDGDPLPPGVVARLGTKRYRPGREKTGEEPNQLTFLPDNHTLVLVTSNGVLQHWDALTGRQLRNTPLFEERISTAANTADGRLLAIGGWRMNDKPQEITNWFKLIDSTTGQESLKWEVAGQRTEHLALSPDGGTVAWENQDKVHVLEVAKQTEVASRQTGPGEVSSLTFSPNGTTLAIGQRGKLLLWNWADKDEPRSIFVIGNPQYASDPPEAVSFSPDGAQVAVGHRDSTGVSLYGVADGHRLRSFGLPDAEYWNLRDFAFSPDGRQLAVPVDDANSGGGIAIWDVATGKLLNRLHGLHGTASCVVFSADGKLLAAATTWDMTFCVWNMATGKPIGADLPGHVLAPNALRFFNHDQQLASAGDDGTIRIWNLADSRQIRSVDPQQGRRVSNRWIRAMDVSSDGKYIASSSLDDTVRVWDAGTGREIYRLPGNGRSGGTRAVRFSPDSRQLASWGDDMQVYVWDIATGKAIQDFEAKPGGQAVRANDGGPFGLPGMMRIDEGRFSPDAASLMIVVNSGNIYRFSLTDGKELPTLGRGGGIVTRLASSTDNQYLVTTSWRRTQVVQLPDGTQQHIQPTTFPVEIWSLPDEKIVSNCEAAGTGADRVTFSPDGRMVAIAVVGDPPRINLRTVPELNDAGQIDLPSRAGAIEFSAASRLLAASIADGTVLVWDLDHLLQKAGDDRH